LYANSARRSAFHIATVHAGYLADELMLTPFGVIDKYFYSGDDNGGPVLGWSSYHAQRILELLDAEGYEIVKKTTE
jgi:hypothetical protein